MPLARSLSTACTPACAIIASDVAKHERGPGMLRRLSDCTSDGTSMVLPPNTIVAGRCPGDFSARYADTGLSLLDVSPSRMVNVTYCVPVVPFQVGVPSALNH